MVRLTEEHYCYNKYCVYQSCDRCACTGITIDATGRCASCVLIPLSAEELKAYKRKYYGIDLEEDEAPYIVDRHAEPEEPE